MPDHTLRPMTPARAPAPAPEPVRQVDPAHSDGPSKPRLVEVELKRKYCPHWLVQPDGSVVANAGEIKETIAPGIVMLHHEEVDHVMRSEIATTTPNTFRGV